MMHSVSRILETVAIIGSLASGCYYFVCLWSAWSFLRERKAPRDVVSNQLLPPVSILKPLKGIDPHIYESFRSHCLQDYPEYEVIFGVRFGGFRFFFLIVWHARLLGFRR